MKHCFYILVLLLGFSACNSNQVKEELSLTDSLVKQKYAIDTQLNERSLAVWVKVKGKPELIKVGNNGYPRGVEITYNVFNDKNGRTRFIAELPFNDSNDWFISYKSYFDTAGNLFAFQKLNNFMNSVCAPGAAVENLTRFYQEGNLVDSLYTLTNTSDQPLNKDSCEFPYNFPFKVISQLDTYKSEKGFKE
jgi:hypothetical protein